MPYSSAAGQPDEGPTIQTLEQFKTVTTLSLNTPIIVYATDGSDESVDRELVTGVHGTGGAIKLARLDATAPELAPLRGQLHLNNLPSTLVLFGGRLMDAYPGVPRGQELQQYLAQILRLADDVAAHRAAQQAQQRPADAPPPPAELLARARAALDDASADVQTAALPLLQEVLAEGSVASDRERCAAYAGAARCAMTQGDLDGAAALLDAARSLLAEDARPPEVEQAALYLDLYREARELGALGAADDAAEAMASKDPERLHKLALQLFAERKHKQALDAALASVRADRQWNDRAAQKLLLASFKALGADNPSVRGARARLTNILFV